MSVPKTVDEQPKRRRGLRRQPEAAPEEVVDAVETEEEEGVEEEEVSNRGLTERKGRATPGRRTQEVEETQRGNFITRPFYALREYIDGVSSEMAKVVWPTREDAQRLTGVVLSVTIASSLVLGALSFIFTQLFAIGLRAPAVFVILFLLVLGGFVYYLRTSNRRSSGY